ncbi:hypothetical protein AJ79_04047 [Helicocarpus griseus UAMH5409]|uniref:C3H1-type domain-containing protein n=1 Tax=Helicocarpus griseus UAMH5409 TaxID=1447875 RepID=A0A2B7XVK5_9EURO|nr:hypothetical protein AJ79_04047 [Helicocarpus griseus UAMH5409]
MPSSRTQKKGITCYYWNDGRCKYDADACMYAHYNTGHIAKKPPSIKSESKLNRQDKQELISLFGDDNMTDDANSSTPAIEQHFAPKGNVATSTEGSEGLGLAKALIKALQANTDYDGIKAMLDTNPSEFVQKALNKDIDGYSAIFEAVKQNNVDIIKLLVQNGANPNATEHNSNIPLLAFAILQDSTIITIQTLLSLGANPYSIPQDLWDRATITSTKAFASDEDTLTHKPTPETAWCSNFHRTSLSKRLDYGLRHHLLAASKLEAPSKKEREVARLLGTESLLHAPYFMVGQSIAIKQVSDYVKSYLAIPSNRPLVLAFAGPPGHGQAEMASYIGKITSLSSVVSRIKKMNKPGAREHVSNSLSSSKQSIGLEVVYIDELDKIGSSNLITLLDGYAQGHHQNKTTNTALNASKTVCILSTTEGEKSVLEFFAKYLDSRRGDNWVPWDWLDKALKKDLVESYGTTLTSHIDAIIPLLPYSKPETTVLAYNYIHDLRFRLATTSSSNNNKALSPLGTIHLELEKANDEAICAHIAETGYDMSLGARSILQEVVGKIQMPVVESLKKCAGEEGYARGKGALSDGNATTTDIFDRVAGGAGEDGKEDGMKAVVKLVGAPGFGAPASIVVSLE